MSEELIGLFVARMLAESERDPKIFILQNEADRLARAAIEAIHGATEVGVEPARDRVIMASVKLGKWLSAALDDPAVCEAMKADIHEWFSAGEPVAGWGAALAQTTPPNGDIRNQALEEAAEIADCLEEPDAGGGGTTVAEAIRRLKSPKGE